MQTDTHTAQVNWPNLSTLWHSFPGGMKFWRSITYFVCLPGVLIMSFNVFSHMAREHECGGPHRPPFVPYDYLRIRTKVSKNNQKIRSGNKWGFLMRIACLALECCRNFRGGTGITLYFIIPKSMLCRMDMRMRMVVERNDEYGMKIVNSHINTKQLGFLSFFLYTHKSINVTNTSLCSKLILKPYCFE